MLTVRMPAPSALLRPAAGLALAFAAAAAPRAAAAVWQVPAQFASIQHALDACAPGDSVLIAPGEYLESFTVRTDSVALLGAGGASDTRIRGFDGTTLAVDGPVRGFRAARLTLRPAPGFPPISVARLHAGCTARFEDVHLEGGTVALSCSAARAQIVHCAMRDAAIGLALEGGGDFTVTDSDIAGNTLGVLLQNGPEPIFLYNRVTSSAIYAVQVSSYTASAAIDLTRNWWGTANESAILASIYNPATELVSLTVLPACGTPSCGVLAAEALTWGATRIRFYK